jgi:hypothetical protein
MSHHLHPKKSSFDNILKFAFITWFFISTIFSYFLIPPHFHSVATDILTSIFVLSALVVFPYFTISRRLFISKQNKIAKKGIDELSKLGIAVPDSVYFNSSKTSIDLHRYSELYSAYEMHQFSMQFLSKPESLNKIVQLHNDLMLDDNPDDIPMHTEEPLVSNPNNKPNDGMTKSPKESFDELTGGSADDKTNSETIDESESEDAKD